MCGPSCRHSEAEPDVLVRFVHRTARDFLLSTAEGHELLRHDPSPREEYQFRVLVGVLIRCRELDAEKSNPHFPPPT